MFFRILVDFLNNKGIKIKAQQGEEILVFFLLTLILLILRNDFKYLGSNIKGSNTIAYEKEITNVKYVKYNSRIYEV